jgi:DNA invertase Pin-like site-specific DNA recombinase
MVYGYARVSTKAQASDGNSLEAQAKALRECGAERIFCDSSTGAKLERPNLDRLLAELREGDTLAVTKLDRIARSLAEGNALVTMLLERKVRVNILNIGVMDDKPPSRLIRSIFLSFAEFERDMILERTQEGKAVARTKAGYREGRPRSYTDEQLRHALELLEGNSYAQVARMTRISKSTILRAKAAKGKNAAST